MGCSYDATVTIQEGDNIVELFGSEGVIFLGDEEVYYREGIWYEKDNEGEYSPDYTVTWFYKDREHPEDYLYYQANNPVVAIKELRYIYGEKDGGGNGKKRGQNM